MFDLNLLIQVLPKSKQWNRARARIDSGNLTNTSLISQHRFLCLGLRSKDIDNKGSITFNSARGRVVTVGTIMLVYRVEEWDTTKRSKKGTFHVWDDSNIEGYDIWFPADDWFPSESRPNNAVFGIFAGSGGSKHKSTSGTYHFLSFMGLSTNLIYKEERKEGMEKFKEAEKNHIKEKKEAEKRDEAREKERKWQRDERRRHTK
jgi:hypothetical protein